MLKGNFQLLSKEHGPMESSNPIGEENSIGLKAFRVGAKPRGIKF
jgi:hypothetical protein